jgi:hypothetical protein
MIQESGLLIRDGGGFALRSDSGRTLRLELSRMPVDLIEKRVRISGALDSDGVVAVEAISACR